MSGVQQLEELLKQQVKHKYMVYTRSRSISKRTDSIINSVAKSISRKRQVTQDLPIVSNLEDSQDIKTEDEIRKFQRRPTLLDFLRKTQDTTQTSSEEIKKLPEMKKSVLEPKPFISQQTLKFSNDSPKLKKIDQIEEENSDRNNQSSYAKRDRIVSQCSQNESMNKFLSSQQKLPQVSMHTRQRSVISRQTSSMKSSSFSPTKSYSTIKRKPKRAQSFLQPVNEKQLHRQKVIDIYNENEYKMFQCIEKKDFKGALKEARIIMEECVDINEVFLFTHMSNFLGLFSRDLSEYNKSAFFFNQYRRIAEITCEIAIKAQALTNLASIATKIQLYEQAIVLLKKSLQYAWKVNEIELELEIYEQIGLNYYYLGNISESYVYHQKFMRADYETEDSPLRIISIAVIDRQLKLLQNEEYFSFKNQFNNSFLLKLSLPIRNKFESNSEIIIYCDTSKNINYENCNAELLIKKIVEEEEFVFFELDQPVYSRLRKLIQEKQKHVAKYQDTKERQKEEVEMNFSFVDEERRKMGRTLKKPKMIKFKSIYGTFENQSNDKRKPLIDMTDAVKYKIPLEKQIQQRLQQKDDLESVLLEVKYNMLNIAKKKNGGQRQKVNLNHMTEEKNQKIKSDQCKPAILIKKYQKYFLNALEIIKNKNL